MIKNKKYFADIFKIDKSRAIYSNLVVLRRKLNGYFPKFSRLFRKVFVPKKSFLDHTLLERLKS